MGVEISVGDLLTIAQMKEHRRIMKVSYAHQTCIYLIKNPEKNINIVKYYYNLNKCLSILIYCKI